VDNLLVSLITGAADLLFGLLLLFGSLFGVIAGLIAAFTWIPLTVAAVLFMFAIKSGIVARFIPHETPIAAAIGIAAIATGLAAVGSFGFLALAMQYDDIRAAFFKAYGDFPEMQKLATYNSFTEKVYVEDVAQYVRYGKMWFYMLFKDGLFFFASTAFLLRMQLTKSSSLIMSIVTQFIVCLIGVVLFALVIYRDDLLEYLTRMDLPEFFIRLIEHIREESRSAYDLLMIPFGKSRFLTFGAWFHDEVAKMGGSIYKMISIYPKLFVVFAAFSLVPTHHSSSLS
jgi:hypothetical protein